MVVILAGLFSMASLEVAAVVSSGGSKFLAQAWQTEDGLPQNTVNAIVQTGDGYLWLGTFGGLARFDGVRFTVYGVNEREGLKNNRILCLLEDRSGTLWIGTEGGGLAAYRAGRFTCFTTQAGLAHNIVSALAEDAEGALWMATPKGLSCLKHGKWTSYFERDGLPGNEVKNLHIGRSGRLWVSTAKGLCFFDGRRFWPAYEAELAGRGPLNGVIEAEDGWFWLYGDDFLLRANHGRAAEPYGFAGSNCPPILAACEGADGTLWLGGWVRGVHHYDGQALISYAAPQGLSDNDVRSLCADREGNLWVGTVGGGLNRMKTRRIELFTRQDGLRNEVAMSLAEEPAGEFWVGSNCGGLYRWQGRRFELASPGDGFPDNACIWPVRMGRDGTLWIGTWGGGLYQYKAGVRVQFTRANGLSDDVVLSLCEDREGGLWIGTYQGGLDYFDGAQLRSFSERDGLAGKYLTTIVQTRDGALWIGSNGGGLNRRQNGVFSVFTTRDGLASNFIRTLYEDAEGRLWIGTGGGLCCWAEGKFFTCASRHGLADDVISQILEDETGNLWLGSNRGILRVRKQQLDELASGQIDAVDCLVYGKEEGLRNLECTGGFHPAGLKSRDGKLWFSTVKGLVMIEPAKMANHHSPPRVLIEAVRVDDQRIPISSSAWQETSPETGVLGAVAGTAISPAPSVTVPAGKSAIELEYTALSFAAPERIQFKYQLKGLDSGWVKAGARRTAYYNHVPPGAYTFQVIACNNDGVWNELGCALALQVLPPFWQRAWFLGLTGLAGAGLLGGGVRYVSVRKLRRKLERLEMLHAVEKERTRIARDIHDDLGAGLTQIALLGELAKREAASVPEMKQLAARITEKTGGLVRDMDEIVWAINPQNDSLPPLTAYLCHFAREFVSPVRCRLDVMADLPAYPLASDLRHHLFLVVKEALNNVVKHAGASEIWLRISVRERVICLALEDNGRGFDTATPRAGGNGLRNMRRRLEEMGGTFELESQPGTGTRIRLTLPLP